MPKKRDKIIMPQDNGDNDIMGSFADILMAALTPSGSNSDEPKKDEETKK